MSLVIQGTTPTFLLPPAAVVQHEASNYPRPEGHKNTPRSFLRKLICCWRGKKNILVDEIKKLAKDKGLIKDSQQKTAKVLEAIQSRDYSNLKSDLRKIIGNMSDQERASLLESALYEDFSKQQKFLGNQCMNLMTLDQFQTLAKCVSNYRFIDVQKTAQEFNEIVQTIKKYDVENGHIKSIEGSKQFFLFKLIKNFIHTIAVAFNLLDLDKDPNSYFETKYKLDIYWRLLEIPLQIVKLIFMILNPIISIAVIAVGTIVSSIAIHFFKKWFKKCPDQLPYCKNLTAEIKNNASKPIYGREKELDEIVAALAANNDIGRKHPLVIGKPGVGKTELMKGLAWRFATGDVPEVLKGKTLFYVNTAELLKDASSFMLKDPLEQIRYAAENYLNEIIPIFDEAQNLTGTLGDRFNTILDTSPGSLRNAVVITDSKQYKEKIEATPLDRRFKKIRIEEASEEQTLLILDTMTRQQAPDIKVSKKVLKAIYDQTNTEITQRSQPDKSIFVMSQALEKISHLQNGGTFDTEMHKLKGQKEKLSAKLARKKLHGISINSEKIQDLRQKLHDVDNDMEKIKQKIEKKKQKSSNFIDLKKQLNWHEKWLYSTSQKIAQDKLKGRKTNELLKKLYLFNCYVLIPQLDKYIANFVKDNDLKVEIDKTMVTEIVNDIAKQEKVEQKALEQQAAR